MTTQLVVWTAIPNGISKQGKLRVSVHVAPRLTPSSTPGELNQFPDWIDWADTPVGWHVKIDGTSYPAEVVSNPSPPLWKKLFLPTTLVEPFDYPDLTTQKVHSYPSLFVRDFFLSTYASLAATSPTNWPSATHLLENTAFGQLPRTDQFEEELSRRLEGMFPPRGGPIPLRPKAEPQLDLLQNKLFLKPLVTPPAGSSWPVPRPHPPTVDFHKAIGLIGRHPALQRVFRLVFDLEVTRPTGTIPGVVALQAEPSWSPKTLTTDVLPIISTQFAPWLPAPRTTAPELNGGYLRLSDPEYGVIEMDLDGGTLKAMDFVKNMYRATTSMAAADTPTDYAVPSLRSAGLSITRAANASAVYGSLQASNAINDQALLTPPGPINLAAEDVTQGYRIDVFDNVRKRWFQLCARSATPKPGPGGYLVGHPGARVPVPAGDEGWVELGLTSGGPPTSSDQYLPETLTRWAGWSLVASRPGRHLSSDPHGGLAADDYNSPTGSIRLQIDYSATPGTLPVQRFGRTYRFRARAVDLAGNSVPFSPKANATSFLWATPEAFYGRLEPVRSPVIVPTSPRTPGEHLERLVIRSNYDIPDSSHTIIHCSRHIEPPVTSIEVAEAHGVLDSPSGVPDPKLYPTLSGRDGLSYATPSVMASLGGERDNQPMNSGLEWIYYPSRQLSVPYLPDAVVLGASFQFLPGVPATTTALRVPFPHARWPKATGFRLDVGAGKGAPTMPAPSNDYTLSVRLPKATFQTVRISSFFGPATLRQMGIWGWLASSGKASGTLAKTILQGRHWMFTPYREIVLVHAVRQPLKAPAFKSLAAQRTAGATFALLGGALNYDPMSTSRLDVHSAWSEPFDDGSSHTGSVQLSGNARVGELSVQPTSPSPLPFGPLREDFGDTKHRLVSYEARATTAFLEYFAETASVTLTGTTPAVVDKAGFAPGTVVVTGTGALDHETYVVNVDYTEDDLHGTLTRTVTGRIGSGARVQATYVVPPVVRSSLEAVAKPPTPKGYVVSIPSTARPLVPDVRYILPAFAWSSAAAPTPTSVRHGHLLRVYLGRPWWETGEGEMLGVVVADAPPGVGLPSELQPFVTGYGRDPLFVTGAVKAPPSVNDFPLASKIQTGLFLAEQTDPFPTVAVAGHTVQWDVGRKLWFADIEINVGTSYWPFVKLALVRYQPASLPGIEVSRVVQADFAQLGATRTATLAFPTPNTVTVTVTGESYSVSNGVVAGLAPDVRVWVQRVTPGVADAELRWTTTPGDPGTMLTGSVAADWTTTWQGKVTLPSNRGTEPFRLLIGERERYTVFDSGDAALRTTYMDTMQI